MRDPKIFLALALTASLAAGCDPSDGDAVSAGPVDATFTVQALNGVSVPSIVPFEQPPLYVGCQLVQPGGVLTLFGNGRYTMQVSSGAVVCSGGAGSGGGFAGTGDYVRDGAVLTLKPDFNLPHIVAAYSPTAGGSVSGTGHNGQTPIPQITFTLAQYEYRLIQEPSELP